MTIEENLHLSNQRSETYFSFKLLMSHQHRKDFIELLKN